MARILITSALPYINGIKHLGNLVGSQLPADLYARYMRARGHEVLFLCATDEHGTPAEIAAAKAGVEGLARSAAATYAGAGIRVNAVAPGLVRTPLSERITSNPAGEKASLAMHALGRLGEPGDVASLIAWLLAEENTWVTGQVLGVDGGLGSLHLRA